MNEMVKVDDFSNVFDVNELTNANLEYIRVFSPEHEMDGKATYNAIQAPAARISESIGDVFNLVGVIAHVVNVTDSETGEVFASPRIILVGSKGETYVGVSKSLYGSLRNLFGCFGTPETWDKNGIKVKIKQTSQGENRRYFSLEVL